MEIVRLKSLAQSIGGATALQSEPADQTLKRENYGGFTSPKRVMCEQNEPRKLAEQMAACRSVTPGINRKSPVLRLLGLG